MKTFSINQPQRFVRAVILSTLLIAGMAFPPAGKAHDPGVSLTGLGTATVDGIMTAGEWDSAGRVNLLVNIPGGTAPATLFTMNDATNLYFALRIARPAMGTVSMVVEFDNNHNGAREKGDDAFVINTSPFAAPDVFDVYRYPCAGDPENSAGCSTFDIFDGGTMDVIGAATNDGTYTVIEASRPLNNADDAHDISLNPGDTVGFALFTRIFIGSELADTSFPACSGCSNAFGDIVIANSVQQVEIDIKPGATPNTVNPGSNAILQVAILSTSSFNATSVNPATVRFGAKGIEASAVSNGIMDVNADGVNDLVLKFRTNATGIICGDTSGILKGSTLSGQAIKGSDAIVTVGCR